jgi:hypothetical protein
MFGGASRYFIGAVDIFGFECFPHNSLEQERSRSKPSHVFWRIGTCMQFNMHTRHIHACTLHTRMHTCTRMHTLHAHPPLPSCASILRTRSCSACLPRQCSSRSLPSTKRKASKCARVLEPHPSNYAVYEMPFVHPGR